MIFLLHLFQKKEWTLIEKHTEITPQSKNETNKKLGTITKIKS